MPDFAWYGGFCFVFCGMLLFLHPGPGWLIFLLIITSVVATHKLWESRVKCPICKQTPVMRWVPCDPPREDFSRIYFDCHHCQATWDSGIERGGGD